MSDLLEQLKQIIMAAAESGEVGCPSKYGFEELEWPGKMCVNSDCAKCWKSAIEHAALDGTPRLHPFCVRCKHRSWFLENFCPGIASDAGWTINTCEARRLSCVRKWREQEEAARKG